MSATDELRKLLDERGVKYEKAAYVIDALHRRAEETAWEVDDTLCEFTEYPAGSTKLEVYYITPERAIAATMGCDRLATGGILSAEQVREAWCGHLKRDCLYDPPTPDWQAIADELNAELETYRKYAEQGECEKPQSGENGDTRERLEAWVYEEIAEKWAQSDRDAALLFEDLYDLMDRMAAITRADYDVYLPQRVAELMGEVDSLTAEREQYRDNMLAQSRRVAELTTERDNLQAAIDAMENGQFYAMYKAKCDECEQLKKVVRTQAESFKKLECELAGKDG